jgi:hypothetical protein
VSVRARRWQLLAITIVGMSAVACSSGSTPHPGSSSPSASTRSVAPAQGYLDAVNALCDALLPKVIAVTNGGSFDIPLKDFFAQLPAHTRLREDFDRQLARIPVPAAAKDEAAVLAAYIRFANELDARRLAAAKQDAVAYAKEIAAEAHAGNDPTIAARNAAGFHDSCNAR